ncbi:hypothetical protein PTKIN_Ptkin01aG0089100 [Pterospermum kingtungense]
MREIEVLITSAQNLKNVKHVTKMKAYTVVYVEKDHVTKTLVDEHRGTNPTWNEKVKVKFHAKLAEENNITGGSDRQHIRAWSRDASEPVDNPIQCMTVQVWRSLGRPQRLLNLWVPPTERFLMRRESLSFNVKEVVEREVVVALGVRGDGGEED